MHRSLSQSLGDDGRLVEFNAESQMDQWMEEAHEESQEHVFGAIVSCEAVFVDYGWPAFGVNFGLEEDEVVVVVLLLAQEIFELGWVVHFLNHFIVNGLGWSLVRLIVDIVALDGGGIATEGIESEKVMHDVILLEIGHVSRLYEWLSRASRMNIREILHC